MALNLKDIIFNSFHTYSSKPETNRLIFAQNRRIRYSTYEINCKENKTTFKELFNISKLYLDELIKKYKNYKLQRKPITDSTFKVIIEYSNEEFYGIFRYKTVFEIDINNNTNEIIYEFKDPIVEDVETNIFSFSIRINVELYNYNKPFFYDGEKQPFIEDICILCKNNKPNVLITKCFHLVVCSDCISQKIIEECPFCKRKPIYGFHKVRFGITTKRAMVNKSTSTTDLTTI